MPNTVKITKKGQVTIPGKIRNILNSSVVEFEVYKGMVVIKPVNSVAGSLQKYSKRQVQLKEIRDRVWEDVVKDRNDL
jgi:AbrB family looped-hinge helix DNA binding protein